MTQILKKKHKQLCKAWIRRETSRKDGKFYKYWITNRYNPYLIPEKNCLGLHH